MKAVRRKSIGRWKFAWPAAFAACCCAATPTSRKPSIWTAGVTIPVRFIFGADCTPKLHVLADDLPKHAWKALVRPARYQVKTQPRGRRRNVKQRIVEERQFQNLRLTGEEVAEFEYRPIACRKTYRLIVVKKYLDVTQGQALLFHDYRYFFYLTNDRESSPAEIVLLANDRCDQENLHAQLKARCGPCVRGR